MYKNLITFVIVTISLVFMVNIIKTIYELSQRDKIVSERAQVREELQVENYALSKEYDYTQTVDFIEGQARDKLNLQKPDEVVLVLPENLPTEAISEPQEAPYDPNWKLWWERFF